jgi:hypothetical protein
MPASQNNTCAGESGGSFGRVSSFFGIRHEPHEPPHGLSASPPVMISLPRTGLTVAAAVEMST